MLQLSPATTSCFLAPSPPTTSTPTMQDNSLTRRQHKGNQRHRRTRSLYSMDSDIITQLQADEKASITRVDSPGNNVKDKDTKIHLTTRDRLAQLNKETELLTDEEQDEILKERLSRRRVSFDLSRNVILTVPDSIYTPSSATAICEPLRMCTLGVPQLYSAKILINHEHDEPTFISPNSAANSNNNDSEDSEPEAEA